ncbi:MAG: UDP-N-acetylmuramoyl-tripeptide--D-alanyl-D-alanine ligase [Williamsia sp.]|nr:UDP-N-acetylmuramoyl-tripeptide--D-alanyl-D-alanine ligase [Williamsia sp.]
MTIEALYQLFLQHPSISTDTRTIRTGDLYFALKGPSFNGNLFARQALQKGAAYAVIDEAAQAAGDKTILVEDTLQTLQELAKHHRQTFSIPFIAITGSNGKTTTKELIHQVLSGTYKTYTTQGNLNNQIGVPLTLLKIRRDAGMAVVEMGANHLREIASYCSYALPTHGIITNCGKAHLEGFGSEENIRKGKGELYDFLREHRGTAFVMWDYAYLQEMSRGLTIIRYGTAEGEVVGRAKQSDPFLEVEIDGLLIQTQLVGAYNLPNVLAAVAVGRHFSVPDAVIKAAIEAYRPSNSRSQLIEQGSNKIVLDAYNANPSSMQSAIENFARMHATSKVVILGGMAELGSQSLQEHQALVDLLKRYSWKRVALVGGDFLQIQHPYSSFPNAAAAAAWFQEQHFTDTHILIKGSRSMQMEKVLQFT